MIHETGITAHTAETAPLAVDGAQPAWMTLNGARERAFTGEIVFETNPEVFAYLDNGIVYYAERASDVSLGRRLLNAGLVDIVQLERGTVRVGDIEHLGRLFDRDPSVDRDAVIVLAETTTQALIAELANQSTATVRFTAYRHHPSGVHRWFVAPLDPAAIARPVSAVAQLDTTVVDELPCLPFGEGDAADLVIEWDEEIDDMVELHGEVFELSLELAEFADHADAAAEFTDDADGTDAEVETFDELDVFDADDEAADDFAFSVVWPDGSEEPATEAAAYVEQSTTPVDVEESTTPFTEVEAAFTESDDGSLAFTMPPLELSDEPELADAEVPDEVAEAVRRAIAAIESASVMAPEVAPHPESFLQLGEIADVEIADEPATADVIEHAPMVQAPTGTPVGLGGFAPPTMAMRAEVLYGQMSDDGSAVDADVTVEGSSPGSGVASVVFVDDPAEEDGSGGGDDRSSALRRLIGGLRRKDH